MGYKKYVVLGKKWRDVINGNTYFSLKIIEVSPSGFNTIYTSKSGEYGYGTQWHFRAKEIIAQHDRQATQDDILYIFVGNTRLESGLKW